MTLGLETEFGGMHFQAVRILSIAGFVRVVVRGELKLIRWTKIDTVFVAWLIVQYNNLYDSCGHVQRLIV